jgi:hypothetical protein
MQFVKCLIRPMYMQRKEKSANQCTFSVGATGKLGKQKIGNITIQLTEKYQAT